jgi:hypothetical protein
MEHKSVKQYKQKGGGEQKKKKQITKANLIYLRGFNCC